MREIILLYAAEVCEYLPQLNSEITNKTNFCQKIGNIRIAVRSYVIRMPGGSNYYTIANQGDLKALLGLENVYTSRLTAFFANGDYAANASAHPLGISIENVNGLANQVMLFFEDSVQGDVRINVLYVYSELPME